jgi:AraC-like DNA-binding protein
MQLTFAEPDTFLKRYVLAYYLFESEEAMVEDVQRADVGALTLILSGNGHFDFADGRREVATPAFLNGPTTSSIAFCGFGPLQFVGISLQPDFWGGIASCSAKQLADDAADMSRFIGPDPLELIQQLTGQPGIAEMAPILDRWLGAMLRPVDPEQRAQIESIRTWLASSPFPSVGELYAQFDVSERQMTRICNRFFGSPPKALSRKYIALRTASAIVFNDEAVLDAAREHYADASHFIREVKRVTGQTPRQLRVHPRPLMAMTLHPQNFRELTSLD